jgi:hypothetical protein
MRASTARPLVLASGGRTLTEDEFKVQVRQVIEAERAQVYAPPEADCPARK